MIPPARRSLRGSADRNLLLPLCARDLGASLPSRERGSKQSCCDWAPIGERPIALGHHRFEWLYVTGFVEPATGHTVWNIGNAVCKEMFELVLADFAKSIGAGANKRVVLQLDNAGWHGPQNLVVPDGICLVFQPAHSPELQPAEHLWAFVDEPLANRCFETIEALDNAVGNRCLALTQQFDTICDSTLFHWWPRQRAKK